MKKHKVIAVWHEESSTEFDPIYAETPQQAEAIALQMLMDRRRDFDKMKGLRFQALNTTR